MEERQQVWKKLATTWRIPELENVATICKLHELDPYIDEILKGNVKGRVLVEMEI